MAYSKRIETLCSLLKKTKTFAQRHFKKNYKHTRYVLCFFVILANK